MGAVELATEATEASKHNTNWVYEFKNTLEMVYESAEIVPNTQVVLVKDEENNIGICDGINNYTSGIDYSSYETAHRLTLFHTGIIEGILNRERLSMIIILYSKDRNKTVVYDCFTHRELLNEDVYYTAHSFGNKLILHSIENEHKVLVYNIEKMKLRTYRTLSSQVASLDFSEKKQFIMNLESGVVLVIDSTGNTTEFSKYLEQIYEDIRAISIQYKTKYSYIYIVNHPRFGEIYINSSGNYISDSYKD